MKKPQCDRNNIGNAIKNPRAQWAHPAHSVF